MKDRNGTEIQVGDTVVYAGGQVGTVTTVSEDFYTCRWDDGKHWDTELSDSELVTVLKSKQQKTNMTPTQKAGLVIGKKYCYTGSAVFSNNNEVVTFIEDDGGDQPQFKSVSKVIRLMLW